MTDRFYEADEPGGGQLGELVYAGAVLAEGVVKDPGGAAGTGKVYEDAQEVGAVLVFCGRVERWDCVDGGLGRGRRGSAEVPDDVLVPGGCYDEGWG